MHFLFPNGSLEKRLVVGGLLLDSGSFGYDFKGDLLFIFFLLSDYRWLTNIILIDIFLRALMFDLLIKAVKQILWICRHFLLCTLILLRTFEMITSFLLGSMLLWEISILICSIINTKDWVHLHHFFSWMGWFDHPILLNLLIGTWDFGEKP